MGISGVAAGYYPAGYASNQTAKTASEKNFAEIAAQKAAGTDTAGSSSEKYPAVVDSIGHNAPEKVKQAFTEAEKETGGFFAGGGMWISAGGKESHMTKMYVDRFVRWLHGETNQSDMLGNTVQSAIDAVNKWMYDLDHPLIGAAPTRPEDRWLVDKERQFYESFLDKLLALSEESAKTSAKETTFAEKVSETEKTGGVAEISEADRLEAFKKEIWNEINSLSWGSSISIQITDEAFEKMMVDKEFKDKMMNLIKEDARGSHIMCGGTLIQINENGFYGYSYMADHAKEADAAYDSHSRDSFYSKKIKKQDAEDIWQKKWLERERLRKERDREYVDKLYFNRSLLRKEQASAAYEANVLTESAESNSFDSVAIGANA